RGPAADEEQAVPELIPARQGEGSGRRRGRPSPAESGAEGAGAAGVGGEAGENGGAESGPPQIGPPQAGSPQTGSPQTGSPQIAQQQAQQQQPQRQALALTSAASSAPSEGSVVTAAEGAQGAGRPQRGQTVPPQGVPVDPQQPVPPAGRRARREG
ncbi:PAS domain S-box protein, partial [Streptomyces sp. SID2119]|nr:PAS domain S-box protein [Streptomyces sp. SID2119]